MSSLLANVNGLVLALVGVSAALLSSSLFASSGTQVATSASTVANAGDLGEATVTVQLAPSDSLSEFDVQISYDPSVISVEDADAIVMNARWDPPAGLPIIIDASTPGTVRVHSTTSDPCPQGGACPLFSFSWVAQGDGTTTLFVTSATLTGTESGQQKSLSGVSVLAGTARVGLAATATPTPTSSPSPSPTPTTVVPTATNTVAPTGTTAAGTPTVTTPSVVPTARATQSSTVGEAAGTAQPPSSGNGLAPTDGPFGQLGLYVLLVAALLSFGLIMSSLRMVPSHARLSGQARTEPSRRLSDLEVIADYLQTMEALGMASSSIELDAHSADDRPPG